MAIIDTSTAINAIKGKTCSQDYTTAHAWKFNSLLHAYKMEHPNIQD